MRKVTFLVIALMVGASRLLAQGLVDFSNYKPGFGIDAPVYDVDGTTPLGSSFHGQLYVALATDPISSLAPVGTAVPFQNNPANGLGTGYVVGGVVTVPFAGGTTVQIQLRAWDSVGGTIATYEAAFAARKKTGVSDLIQILITEPPQAAAALVMLDGFVVFDNFVVGGFSLSTAVSPVGSGSVGIVPIGWYYADYDRYEYDDITVVTLTANPTVGYLFSHWSGDASGSANPTTVKVDFERRVTANFTPSTPGTQQICYDFDDGAVPPGADIGGIYPPGATPVAFVDTVGGVGNSGVLKLTTSENDQIGGFRSPLLADGAPLVEFTFTAEVLAGNGTAVPADGFSINIANDLPILPPGVAENGAGTGITVAFDTYDNEDGDPNNGTGEAPSIDVRWQGLEIAVCRVPLALLNSGTYQPILLHVAENRLLDLVVGTTTVYQDLPLPGTMPMSGLKFALYARTGGANASYWFDNICFSYRTSVTPKRYALTTAVLPSGAGTVGISPSSADGKYDENTEVMLTAHPFPGYVFSSWSGDASGGVSQRTITMNGNKSVTANFTSLAIWELEDVTQPGDSTIPSSSNSPLSEGAANAIDGTSSKYLNFDTRIGGNPSGFVVTPSVGSTLVTGMTITSADDAPERDPKLVTLEGSNDDTVIDFPSGNWDLICVLDDIPAWGARHQTQTFHFDNCRCYKHYRWTVIETQTINECCMQVAEVELVGGTPQDVTRPGDLLFASSLNSPTGSREANAIDDTNAKYLNLDTRIGGKPSGFTVRPSIGATTVIGMTITSADDAPERDPKVVTLEGSNDDTVIDFPSGNWDLICVLDDIPPWTARHQTQTFCVPNRKLYRQYRWTVIETQTINECCMQVAEVELLHVTANRSYELSLTSSPSGAGTVEAEPAPMNGRYTAGRNVTLTAKPNSDYVFGFWSGDLSGSAATASIIMNGNKSVTAHFVPTPNDVTQPGDPITATSKNSPTDEVVAKAIDNEPGTKYLNFDKLNTGFTVTPSVGPTVVNGLGLTSANDSPERDPASYRLEGSSDGKTFSLIAAGTVATFTDRFEQQNLFFDNTTAYATYRLIFPTVVNAATADSMQIAEVQLFGMVVSVSTTYSLTLNAGPGGTIEANPASVNGRYTSGTTVTLAAKPNSGYHFVSWTENGVVLGANVNLTINISTDRTLIANFAPTSAQYQVNLSAAPSTGGTVNGGGGYTSGETVTATATASAGYVFVNWTEGVNEVSTLAHYSFNASANRTLVAHFIQSLADITKPSDPITATSGNSPAVEDVTKAIDNQTGTKYLNFDKLNTGFTVTPSVGLTVVTGLGLTSANDFAERDPASYLLEGSLNGKTFTLISSGTVTPFTARFEQQNLFFVNTTAYATYRLIFPTVVNAGTANCMQIGEVQLFGTVASAPEISITWINGMLTLFWDPAATGYTLETTMNLRTPVLWTTVAGVVNNRISISARTGTSFYRLRR